MPSQVVESHAKGAKQNIEKASSCRNKEEFSSCNMDSAATKFCTREAKMGDCCGWGSLAWLGWALLQLVGRTLRQVGWHDTVKAADNQYLGWLRRHGYWNDVGQAHCWGCGIHCGFGDCVPLVPVLRQTVLLPSVGWSQAQACAPIAQHFWSRFWDREILLHQVQWGSHHASTGGGYLWVLLPLRSME